MINYLITTIIICFIIDISGAPQNLFKPIIKNILHIPARSDISIKPFDCSLCLTLWINLIILLIGGPEYTWYLDLLIISMLSLFSKNISDLLILASDIISLIVYSTRKILGI